MKQRRLPAVLLGRKGEVWGAESGTDRLVVIRFP
jgi:streptogramin lyase